MTEINPLVWFGNRELSFIPKHFIKAPTSMTAESLFWVRSKLSGRFSFQPDYDEAVIFSDTNKIYFEDSADVMFYELRWSGTNIFDTKF
jgi:hypothetical protein